MFKEPFFEVKQKKYYSVTIYFINTNKNQIKFTEKKFPFIVFTILWTFLMRGFLEFFKRNIIFFVWNCLNSHFFYIIH